MVMESLYNLPSRKKCNEELFKASKFSSRGDFHIFIHLVTLNICNEVRTQCLQGV